MFEAATDPNDVDDQASFDQATFDKNAADMAADMKSIGSSVDETTAQIKIFYNTPAVASALKVALGITAAQIAKSMKQADYMPEEVALGLKHAYGDNIQIVASSLQTAYGWDVHATAQALNLAGFTFQQIGNAYKLLGGEFASASQDILNYSEAGDL